MTCADGLAVISLILTLIERHCGIAVKTNVARDLVACELRPTGGNNVNHSPSMDGAELRWSSVAGTPESFARPVGAIQGPRVPDGPREDHLLR